MRQGLLGPPAGLCLGHGPGGCTCTSRMADRTRSDRGDRRCAGGPLRARKDCAEAETGGGARACRSGSDLRRPGVGGEGLAGAAGDLDALEAALASFEHCELRRGARNLVFADGRPGARVMIAGEAPGRDEDLAGKPFVGRAGQLLDRMFAAIGLSRESTEREAALYITNVLPWRPPQNRDPRPDEIAMLLPFVERHVELAAPDFLIAMGNHACAALLGRRGITRLRGTWAEALGKPVMPMFHPAYLLRTSSAKREAWADLLDLKARLK